MEVPAEYHGREQSFLKHRVLHEYLVRWGRKIGSLSRKRTLRVWYVDCFAGPWSSGNPNLEDTSIHIGVQALAKAAETWRAAGHGIEANAVFVESNRSAFETLRKHLADREGPVKTQALHGEFGQHVDTIAGMLGEDPAFIFVDPTGFKGVAMSFIASLARHRMRDVLVNVMFEHINRWKDDPRGFLRDQMREFFGLEDVDLPPGLSEDDLLALYRENLKTRCGLKHAADLAVPHPTRDRSWFHLVVGGNHQDVLRVFRDVETSVIATEAAAVRDGATKRRQQELTGQYALPLDTASPVEPRFEARYGIGPAQLVDHVVAALGPGRRRFDAIWPALLEAHHVPFADVARAARDAEATGRLAIDRKKSSARRALPKDDDFLRRLDPPDPAARSSRP
jgi:three-Cys-motif partner protein